MLKESSGLKVQELARAQELAEQNKRLIIERWRIRKKLGRVPQSTLQDIMQKLLQSLQ